MTRNEVATLVQRIGGALVAAADAGVVHGRVTSDNVLYDAAGDPFLTDFVLVPGDHTPSDDVRDFADLVRRCWTTEPDAAADALARATGSVGRPAMAELVVELEAALADAPLAPEPPRPNPYKGLRSFDEADAVDFFGRADLIDEILARLGADDLRGRLVLVVGGSGSGKSSAVLAGLLPRIRRGEVSGSEKWFVTTMMPGSSPFKELAESLRRVAVDEPTGLVVQLASDGGIDRVVRSLVPDDGQLLLVVDQFEELFTLATEPDQRAFLSGLMHAVSTTESRVRVVATLRADFYDRPLAVQPLATMAYEATVTIPAMTPAELEAAIVEPAERVGGHVERALVAELVSAVADQPAALPSLQFTLYELAERSPDLQLALAAYRELGGVAGAIASRAELLYTSLDDAERAAARHLFMRLVVVSAEGEPTRRRAARDELSAGAWSSSADAVIDRWAEARLLTLDRHPQTREPTVELAHEALLREWPRLRQWIEEDRAVLLTFGHLREAAAGWVALDRDRDALFQGARLEIALAAVEGRTEDLPDIERQFLEASVRQEEERLERQARANRRLRIQLAAVAAALVVAVVGGFVAVDQRGDAQRQRRVATVRELAAASAANLEEDPERSVLLALTAVEEARGNGATALREATDALHRAVTASRVVLSVPDLGGSVAWGAKGNVFVTEGPEQSGVIDIRDADTGASVRSFKGHDVDVNEVAFSVDGSVLATTGDDGAARLWDPETGEQLAQVLGVGPVWRPSFSADGSLVAAVWLDESPPVRIASTRTGEVVSELELPTGSAALSPDGSRVVLDMHVVDARSGERVVALAGPYEWADPYVWSPDGRWIAAAAVTVDGDPSQTPIWDATTGEQVVTLDSGNVYRLAWSPDGSRLATFSHEGIARVWEVDVGFARELFRFSSGDQTSAGGIAFSPDGERVIVGDGAITAVRVYDASIRGGREWANVPDGVPGTPGGASFTADGRHLVTSSGDGAGAVWDAERGDRKRLIAPGSIAVRVEVSPDGALVAGSTLPLDGPAAALPITLWDAETGRRIAEALADGAAACPDSCEVFELGWSPDGQHLGVIHGSWTSRVLSVVDRDGVLVATLRPQDDAAAFTSLSFSADGRLLATTEIGLHRADPEVEHVSIWDRASGKLVRTIDTQAGLVVFDPTGDRLVTSGYLESVIEVWDARTGERLRTLAGHNGSIRDLAFSRDGSKVASASEDGTARVWDPASGLPLQVLRDQGPVASVAFSPDGSKLVSVSNEGIARVWALDLDDLIAIAASRLTRGFTDEECREYLHAERCPAPPSAG